MKLKRFEELNEEIKPSEQLNEKFWIGKGENIKDMKIKFDDDDELGYVPYLYITSNKGQKYYCKLKIDSDNDYDED
jgi:hypothetical protein